MTIGVLNFGLGAQNLEHINYVLGTTEHNTGMIRLFGTGSTNINRKLSSN